MPSFMPIGLNLWALEGYRQTDRQSYFNNIDKTEALLFQTNYSFIQRNEPNMITHGSSDISFSINARYLGFFMSNNMSVDAHINNIGKSAYAALCRISAIRKHLTEKLKIENCTILIPKGNSYCRRKSSARGPRFKVSSEELSAKIDIPQRSPIQVQTKVEVA